MTIPKGEVIKIPGIKTLSSLFKNHLIFSIIVQYFFLGSGHIETGKN